MSPSRTRAARTGPKQQLATYRAKRDFAVTAEPAGGDEPAPLANRFVVQRHRATRLHYDLRLEMNGVLVSWAVPKGPTLDPGVKRMAVHVEDHPLEYFDFEGVIPKREYGGGDVIVWDWGTWAPAGSDDPGAAVKNGELHFDLVGEKLRGRFALVRRGSGASSGGKEQWLLIHKRDEHAVDGWDPEQHRSSVKSGRTNDDVAAEPRAQWTRNTLTVARWAQYEAWPAPTGGELASLDAMRKEGFWELGGREIRVTNLDKVLCPARDGTAVTKRELVKYYATVAPLMLPYLAGRAVNLHRYPSGVGKPGFWHKARPDHAPDFVKPWHYADAEPDETQIYSVIDNPAALAWMANFGAIELNPWTSRVDAPHEPTWALIDVDPGESSTFDDVITLARLYRTALDHLRVKGIPKVTGKRGIQIWVPVAAGYTFDDTRAWVEEISRAIGAAVPDLVSWAWTKRDRDGKARLDYTQNVINKTLVAPFSVRPAAGAPVSVPIEWDELEDPELTPDRWTIRDVLERLLEQDDPLRSLVGLQQQLPEISSTKS
ncbi:MAG TPA: DNA polymerase ligase N-terminal domain-containing protein [Acidimicrobiales bacterium]|nr:DNA polymerase ligase N-terminal domain-containing protein [Acidimicrobiales bacterium]